MVRPAFAKADGNLSVNLDILPKMLDILKLRPPPHDVERQFRSHQAVFFAKTDLSRIIQILIYVRKLIKNKEREQDGVFRYPQALGTRKLRLHVSVLFAADRRMNE
ncbi:hypothetical protein X975_12529, partial [Stegodyphus mimosarum]